MNSINTKAANTIILNDNQEVIFLNGKKTELNLNDILDKNLTLKEIGTVKSGVKYELITKKDLEKQTFNLFNQDILTKDNILISLKNDKKEIEKEIKIIISDLFLDIKKDLDTLKNDNKEFSKKGLIQHLKNVYTQKLSKATLSIYLNILDYFEFNLSIDFKNIDYSTFNGLMTNYKLSIKEDIFNSIISKNEIKKSVDYKDLLNNSNKIKNDIRKNINNEKIINNYLENNQDIKIA